MSWEPEVKDLEKRHAIAEAMGGPEGVERQHKYGKLTVRERIHYPVGLAGSLQYRPGPHLYKRYAWPSGHWGSMHIEGGASAAFRKVIEAAPDPEAKRLELEAELQALGSPFRTAEATGLDLIDPRDTRPILADFVDMAQGVIRTQLGPGNGPVYRP